MTDYFMDKATGLIIKRGIEPRESYSATVVFPGSSKHKVGHKDMRWDGYDLTAVEVGTLDDLGAQPGDKVQLISIDRDAGLLGEILTIDAQGAAVKKSRGGFYRQNDQYYGRLYRMVERAKSADPVALGDMTWEDAEPLYRAWHKCEPLLVRQDTCSRVWRAKGKLSPLFKDSTYRLPTKFKPTFAHWAALDERVQFLARDNNEAVWGYSHRPQNGNNCWDINNCRGGGNLSWRFDGLTGFDWGDLPWNECIIERPEDV